MDAAERRKYHTIEDIFNLSDGQRAELIDGEIYLMAVPGRIHQKLLHFLDRTIGNYIQDKSGSCEVYPAPFAVYLEGDDEIYVEPDISVICEKDKLTADGCSGAPDWIVEIVSPSSRRMDYYIKLFKYRTAGVREYWIADPMRLRIMVYNFEADTVDEYSFNDRIKAGIYDDLEIDFSTVSLE